MIVGNLLKIVKGSHANPWYPTYVVQSSLESSPHTIMVCHPSIHGLNTTSSSNKQVQCLRYMMMELSKSSQSNSGSSNVKHWNRAVIEVLVQWSNTTPGWEIWNWLEEDILTATLMTKDGNQLGWTGDPP